MFFRSTSTQKKATLQAANLMFSILIGLALKEVLGERIIDGGIPPPYLYHITVTSYVLLALMFMHRVALISGYESERFDKGMIAASWRMTTLAAFIALTGVVFALMANNLRDVLHDMPEWLQDNKIPTDMSELYFLNATRYYFRHLWILSGMNLLVLLTSNQLRLPYRLNRLRTTEKNYTARVVYTWLLLGIVQFVAVTLLLTVCYIDYSDVTYHERIAFSSAAIAAINLADYLFNRRYYFGGTGLAVSTRLVYVSVDFPPPSAGISWCASVVQAIRSCRHEMRPGGVRTWSSTEVRWARKILQGLRVSLGWIARVPPLCCAAPLLRRNFGSHVIAFSPLAFYGLFLDLSDPNTRGVAIHCANRFLDAFHTIHFHGQVDKCDMRLTQHTYMEYRLAKMRGLHIAASELLHEDPVSETKSYIDVDIERLGDCFGGASHGKLCRAAEPREPIKRVFVCTALRDGRQRDERTKLERWWDRRWKFLRNPLSRYQLRLPTEQCPDEWVAVSSSVTPSPTGQRASPLRPSRTHEDTDASASNTTTWTIVVDGEPAVEPSSCWRQCMGWCRRHAKLVGPSINKRMAKICTWLCGRKLAKNRTPLKAIAPEAQLKNAKAALLECWRLMNSEESVAPVAPQAFYPFFFERADDGAWQRRASALLRACDAVYFYTPDGMPRIGDLSNGMMEVYYKAMSMGLAIEFRAVGVVDGKEPTLSHIQLRSVES